MRPASVLTALFVLASLYLLVFEREALVAIASGDSADESAPEETDSDDETAERVSVVAIRSEEVDVERTILVRGRTEAARQVELRAETGGKVIGDPPRKGSQVEEGDLLCALDPGTRETALSEALARLEEARSRLPEAEARLNEAAINLNAAQKLFEQGHSTKTGVAAAEAAAETALSGLEAARAAVSTANSGVASAEKEIERLSIRAPFSGLLETDAAETGSLLQPGELCATIIQLDPIRLVGFLPEIDLGMVGPGAPAGARLVTGREVRGEVTFVSRSADPQTRTFRVEITAPNGDLGISDGQTAEILIRAAGSRAHLIPQSALTLDDDGRLGIRSIDGDGTAKFAEVSVLRDAVDGVWVAGLPPIAEIIVVGQEFVADGVPVDATFREVPR